MVTPATFFDQLDESLLAIERRSGLRESRNVDATPRGQERLEQSCIEPL